MERDANRHETLAQLEQRFLPFRQLGSDRVRDPFSRFPTRRYWLQMMPWRVALARLREDDAFDILEN